MIIKIKDAIILVAFQVTMTLLSLRDQPKGFLYEELETKVIQVTYTRNILKLAIYASHSKLTRL